MTQVLLGSLCWAGLFAGALGLIAWLDGRERG
jgi:hypothetical protein